MAENDFEQTRTRKNQNFAMDLDLNSEPPDIFLH